MKVLITGAAGNLGSLLAEYLLESSKHDLRLMVHRRGVREDLAKSSRVEIARADLGVKESVGPAVAGVDAIVHFAGVLFKAGPEKFLHVTNTEYFENLADAAQAAGVEKVILVSFPHVEGPTSIENPATGRQSPIKNFSRILLLTMSTVHSISGCSGRKYLIKSAATSADSESVMIR